MPLVFIGLILVLSYAAIYDVKNKKIANWLCFLILGSGIGVNFLPMIPGHLVNSLVGMCVGFTALFIFHVLTGMGAGDVKLMAAIGSVVGVKSVLYIIFYSFVISGLFSIGYLLYCGGGKDMMRRFGRFFFGLYRGRLSYQKPKSNQAAAIEIPLAPGIALATLWELFPVIQNAFLSGRYWG